MLSAIDMVTFGLFGSLLDRIPRKRKPSPEETPRTQGTWGNALAMYRVGSSVKKVDAPLQAVTTEADPFSGKPQVAKLLKNSSNGQNIGWYHFSAEDKVQHAMVSPQENKNEDSVDLVRQIVSNMVETGIPTSNHEVPAPSKTAKPLQFAPG